MRLFSSKELNLRKECGNRWFSYKEYGRAARAYSKGTKVADDYFNGKHQGQQQQEPQQQQSSGSDDDSSAQQLAAMQALQRSQADGTPISPQEAALVEAYMGCLNNLAACHVCEGEYLKAKEMCVKVLEMNPSNIKALLRAAKSCLALSVSIIGHH
jgi:hypothetical protein